MRGLPTEAGEDSGSFVVVSRSSSLRMTLLSPEGQYWTVSLTHHLLRQAA